MPLRNTAHRYGSVTKSIHWTVFLLLLLQYVGANVMTRMGREATVFGIGQDFLYDWHKSLGLVLFGLTAARLAWRNATPLPDWSPILSQPERELTNRLEHLLYVLLLALPLTGYLFVMAGDYGIRLFGSWHLPNPVGKVPVLAGTSLFLHVLLGYLALIVLSWHVGHVLKKHCYDGNRYLQRMLPLARDFTAPPRKTRPADPASPP
jgi:cytochrome b561